MQWGRGVEHMGRAGGKVLRGGGACGGTTQPQGQRCRDLRTGGGTLRSDLSRPRGEELGEVP